MGKRVTGRFFVDEVAAGGAHACSYLLGCDVEMEPLPGYRLTSWATGYHDVQLRPDLATLRRLPWLERTALVLCDVCDEEGAPVAESPRQILQAQVARAERLGVLPMVASELEFYIFRETLRARPREAVPRPHALRALHRGLSHPPGDQGGMVRPADPQLPDGRRRARRVQQGRVGTGTARDQPALRAPPSRWPTATRCSSTARRRSPPSTASRSRSWRSGAPTSRDRPATCTAACGTRRARATCSGTTAARPLGMSATFRHYLGGQLAGARQLAYFFAPYINSYKRYLAGHLRPGVRGVEPRQPHLRVPGRRRRGRACGSKTGSPART